MEKGKKKGGGFSWGELMDMARHGVPEKVYDNDFVPVDDEPAMENDDFLRGLPGFFYGLAFICGFVLLIFTIMISDDLSAAQTGGMIGWIIGAVLGMLATGRLVELVQRISDDIRIIRDGTVNGSEETVAKGESVPPPEDDPQ